MQIQNFYSDPVPSVRNPLDSIVLSPHTIKGSDFGLADMGEESNGYQSVLPSIYSCEYHDHYSCKQANSSPRHIWDRCLHILRSCGRRKASNLEHLDVEPKQ